MSYVGWVLAGLSVSLIAFLSAALASLAATPLVARLAVRCGAVDRPGGRRIHRGAVPRLGGVAVFLALCLATALAASLAEPGGLLRRPSGAPGIGAYLICSALILLVGAWDDLRGLRPAVKLAAQVAVAVLAYALGFRIGAITTPFGAIDFGNVDLMMTVVWIVAIVNAVNLIDGLDGLAAGVALIALSTVFAVAASNGRVEVCILAASLGGALAGFLRYNSNPASVFLGDSGSLTVGFLLATFAISGSQKTSTVVALLIPVMALGIPIFDTLVAIVRRSLSGEPVFSADSAHLHHKLLDLGLSPRRAVLALYAVSAVLAGTALVYHFSDSRLIHLWVLLFLLSVGLFAAIRRLGYIQPTVWRRRGQARRALIGAIDAGRRAGAELALALERGDGDALEATLLRGVPPLENLEAAWVPDAGAGGSVHLETERGTRVTLRAADGVGDGDGGDGSAGAPLSLLLRLPDWEDPARRAALVMLATSLAPALARAPRAPARPRVAREADGAEAAPAVEGAPVPLPVVG